MAPDPDLPAAPLPSADSRARAIDAALARFDAAQVSSQGFSEGTRLTERQTALKRPAMVQPRYALATAAIVVIAVPFAWKLIQEHQGATMPPVGRQEAQAPAETAPVAANAPPPTPSNGTPGDTSAGGSRLPQVTRMPGPVGIGQGYGFDAGSRAEGPQPHRAETAPSAVPKLALPAPAPAETGKRQVQALSFSRGHRDGNGEAASAAELPTRTAQATPAPLGNGERRPQSWEPKGRDSFAEAKENGFRIVSEAPLSTFSIDVDTASYSFLRASLARNVLPPKASVRTEELINYFPYAYAGPASAAEPFAVTSAVYPSPWAEGRKIVQVGIKGYAVAAASRPAANLVFLIDTSGSMSGPGRLPLVKKSLALLLTQLKAKDRVAIVAYAGHAGTVLEPTPADQTARILGAIDTLAAGGGTAGGAGIQQAYALAERGFDPKAVNRVILATDGDFNVGIANRDELKGFVERQRGKGIFLSVLGFGMGNYNDALMQALAQNGNGAAAYIDTLNEARKVLVEEATSTLIPIAKDVKIQVEFNPAAVAEYRLIGYESRLLAREDFSNDKVDAGDVGSGQSVTALYEIVPVGGPRLNGDLRYGEAPATAVSETPSEYAHVAIRYKLPKSDTSTLMTMPIDRSRESARFADAPQEARFATSVAAFGELLKGGKYTGTLGFEDVARMASAAKGEDAFGYRAEFVQLVRAAKTARGLESP